MVEVYTYKYLKSKLIKYNMKIKKINKFRKREGI